MYLKIFSSNFPVIDSWNLCHLWAAQCLISSIIASDEHSYKAINTQKELKNNINFVLEKDVFSRNLREEPLFTDNKFKKCVKNGISLYLDYEARHILKYIKCNKSLSPVPQTKNIMKLQKNNLYLIKYHFQTREKYRKLIKSIKKLSGLNKFFDVGSR